MAEALSLAACIVQFADHARKVVVWSFELYGSVDGATEDNEKLEKYIQDVANFNADITTEKGSSSWTKDLAPDERVAIEELAVMAESSAKDLLQILQGLKAAKDAGGKGANVQSLMKAIKTMMKSGEMEKIQKQIEQLQAQMSHRVLRSILDGQVSAAEQVQGLRQQLIEIKQTIDGLKPEYRAGIMAENEDPASMSEPMKAEVSRFSELVQRQCFYPKRLLEELRYSTMTNRGNQIKESFTGTSKWVYEEERCKPFLKWLEVGSGVFWFSGKPGSGKSTLFKHIQGETQTTDAIGAWAGSSKLLIASHYFWISSEDPLQRSLEGFYRNILHQLCVEEPDLIPILFPYEDRSKDLASRLRFALDANRLKESSIRLNLRYFFFIDGLDEFQESGNKYSDVQIASMISELASMPFLKICASSRPASAFEQAFGKRTFQIPETHEMLPQSIIIQNFTFRDMEKTVLEKFVSRPNWVWTVEKDPRWESIGSVIATKAEGVWLWTELVMRDLGAVLGEFSRGEDYDKIMALLAEYPSDLDDLYMLIWEKKVDPAHRTTAILIFSVMLQATTPIFASDIRFLLLEQQISTSSAASGNYDCYIQNSLDATNRYPRSLCYLDGIRSQLHNRCSDFLEIPQLPPTLLGIMNKAQDENYQSRSVRDLYAARVAFIHRSAKDFLAANIAAFRQSLASSTGYPQEPDNSVPLHLLSMAISVGSLSSFSRGDSHSSFIDDDLESVFRDWFRARWHDFFFHASRIDTEFRNILRLSGPKQRTSAKGLERLSPEYAYDPQSVVGRQFQTYLRLVTVVFSTVAVRPRSQDKPDTASFWYRLYLGRDSGDSCRISYIIDYWIFDCYRWAAADGPAAVSGVGRVSLEQEETIQKFVLRSRERVRGPDAVSIVIGTVARLHLFLLQHHGIKVWRKQRMRNSQYTSLNFLLAMSVFPSGIPEGDAMLGQQMSYSFDYEVIRLLLDLGANVNQEIPVEWRNKSFDVRTIEPGNRHDGLVSSRQAADTIFEASMYVLATFTSAMGSNQRDYSGLHSSSAENLISILLKGGADTKVLTTSKAAGFTFEELLIVYPGPYPKPLKWLQKRSSKKFFEGPRVTSTFLKEFDELERRGHGTIRDLVRVCGKAFSSTPFGRSRV
ncbi:hypothetical protein BJ508DRAFT_365937 [Ascobolus immersus RN42]|uniref:NACHT domain-containing protein n=1 Tax=Ascobolus immersus RN42 TaxID=1160509 RepID=A0A3N4HM55_ASCIM|nr:hypothetical protein BJ508DRAFT_365937 [Ascobolus immersus RN42]